MRLAKLVGPREFAFEEVPTPEPGPGQVLLQVGYVALCGSEFAPYKGQATEFPIYKKKVAYPRALGHEGNGTVVRLGPGVTGVREGDRVIPARAAFATHALCRAEELTPIPPEIPLREAAITFMAQETYFLCRHMVTARPEDRALIVGMGPFGMLCLEHLREIGCSVITAVDLLESRLVLAQELGATHTINAGTHDLVDAAAGLPGGKPTLIIETSGQPQPLHQVFRATAPRGRVAVAGRPYAPLDGFTIEDFFHNLLTVYGAKIPPEGYARQYTAATLELIRAHRIHASRLITHEFPLAQIRDAFEMATHPEAGGLKIVVNCAEPVPGEGVDQRCLPS
jgi:threonine dehydrogenase-like Zn-dependent dehydrogenase